MTVDCIAMEPLTSTRPSVLEDGLKAKRQRLAQLQAPSTVTEGAIQGDCESGGGRSPNSTSKRKRATSTVSEGSKATVPKKKKRAMQDGRARALGISFECCRPVVFSVC